MRCTRLVIPVILLSAILSGCAAEHEESSSPRTETEPVALNDMQTQTQTDAPNETEAPADSEEKDALSAGAVPEAAKEPADVPPVTTLRPDWSSYFGDLNGAAVIFDPDGNTFQIPPLPMLHVQDYFIPGGAGERCH